MFHIKSVEIEGFWGKYSIKTNFFPEVNIFIGKNGTGKTTFMNILQSVLQVDLQSLISIDFTCIVIKLNNKSKIRTIKVSREDVHDVPFEKITFRVGSKSYPLQIFEGDVNFRKSLMHRRKLFEQFQELRIEIQNLVQVASLSVHRVDYDLSEVDNYQRKQMFSKSSIDHRLEQLMQALTSYQLSLELQARKESKNFEKDVLVSMLYDEQFDSWDLQEALSIELSKEKSDLSKAYQELGVLDDKVSKKIDKHIKALNASLKSLRDPKTNITIRDIFPLPLLRRTQHIINLTKMTEEKKQKIFQPIKKYIDIIVGFMEDKKLSFNAEGELQIFKDEKEISISSLSSGEKQLLILLTETLLQKNGSFIFLADEPELSLHIEWQSMVIDSIKKLNQNAQIIVATHSPEIAGGWGENIIDMEDIFNG